MKRVPPAPFQVVHADDVEFPALERADGAIQKFWRDLIGEQRLEPPAMSRPHALKTQDDSGAAGPAPG